MKSIGGPQGVCYGVLKDVKSTDREAQDLHEGESPLYPEGKEFSGEESSVHGELGLLLASTVGSQGNFDSKGMINQILLFD